MTLRTVLTSVLASLALASPAHRSKPVAFFLAGDSTTAIQSTGGGGWGSGFLATLRSPAYGVNKGHNGATTVSFVDGGDWAQVLDLVKNATAKYDVYVSIQFGHNDQKPAKNITMPQFKANLQNLAQDVQDLGATPLLLTSLARRNFNGTLLKQDLADVVPATREAAAAAHVTLIDLNAASRAYVQAIGSANADKYNLVEGDRTHLNAHGSEVFGRIVADLILKAERGRGLGRWIVRNGTLSALIREGVYA
ncbi:SGNH hydrolase [Bimuria novae-zelandiae CBS 107.79]|uniref:SGNH hydrolase n=1 Tax=Bimuria novae-zelandiae CBS 107.79 TaxID=1447943 RepID=A0A6A5UMD4_9PLEO|nr:SGNH hydrolase [Bimuria novae-zelandiae CBS 107.79]